MSVAGTVRSRGCRRKSTARGGDHYTIELVMWPSIDPVIDMLMSAGKKEQVTEIVKNTGKNNPLCPGPDTGDVIMGRSQMPGRAPHLQPISSLL